MVGSGNNTRTIFLVGTSLQYGPRFLGLITSVLDLQFLIRRLRQVGGGGLTPQIAMVSITLLAPEQRYRFLLGL